MRGGEVTIDDNSPLITLDIANLRQYGMVKVRKTAEDGLVEGLTFRLTGTSEYGEPVNMAVATNVAGTAVFGASRSVRTTHFPKRTPPSDM